MKFNKPDGVIEISNTGCCCPPGENRGGQHTNAGDFTGPRGVRAALGGNAERRERFNLFTRSVRNGSNGTSKSLVLKCVQH